MSKIKGFTLFTALVGFIIIGIGVLVIQHMSNSEQNYQSLLNSLLTQQEMDSSIHIIKLDAISAFDLIYRCKFYDFYKDKGQTGIQIITDSTGWENYKARYIDETFGVDITAEEVSDNSNKVSGFVTSKLLSLLVGYKGSYKGGTYSFTIYDYYYQSISGRPIDLSDLSNTASLTGTQLANSINQSTANQNFLNILDCKNDSCERGSFYTNFDFTKIPYSLYLNLPRILIINNLDKSQIDDAILPYSKLSLYVPMRLFGAFKLAYDTIEEFSNSNLKNLKFGHNLENISCSSFNDSNLDALRNFESIDLSQKLTQISSNYNNCSKSNFQCSLESITMNKDYPSDIFLIYVGNQVKAGLQQRMLNSVNISFNIIDNDLFENVGRRSMEYNLVGTKTINKIRDPTIKTCSCVQKPDNTLDCQNGNNYSFLDIKQALKDLGLMPDEEIDSLNI